MSDWQIVIGLETHVQLNTASKLFSMSPASYCDEPNLNANELDFGMPGTLPVCNREAVEKAIRFGLSVNAKVANQSEFSRKHYFYPDLPKGYQISQFEHPIVIGGVVEVASHKNNFTVPLTRAHLEEDAGKLQHDALVGSSVVDLNRAGVPLLEIVSEPTMRNAQEARDYGRALRELVCWLGICDGNMQEGSMRFDVNISLRKSENDPLGTRTETKNLNSFRFMEQAINYEVDRQRAILEDGGEISQQTLLFDPDKGITKPMRSKEEAEDYRYMPDPDLLLLNVSDEWIQKCKDKIPELPAQCRQRLIDEHQLSEMDAFVIASSKTTVDYFIDVTKTCSNAKIAANWITGDIAALCKENDIEISDGPLEANRLAGLINKVLDNTISGKMAKELLPRMWASKETAEEIIAEEGLQQITDSSELEAIVTIIIDENPKQVQQYRDGKTKVLGFFVGQAMKATKGKGNPKQLDEISRSILDK